MVRGGEEERRLIAGEINPGLAIGDNVPNIFLKFLAPARPATRTQVFFQETVGLEPEKGAPVMVEQLCKSTLLVFGGQQVAQLQCHGQLLAVTVARIGWVVSGI